ncbi:unnamed protein product [Lactuca virosa]|uniref:Lipid IV(A) 3-deoxy-D-manno-octulosonic acid transferase n=1 Tax=Lactuca virosa TaxID=75947 RepID=A0AAU9MC56_9ASTR|nr:unnamed protein product [Lactuca virosa]
MVSSSGKTWMRFPYLTSGHCFGLHPHLVRRIPQPPSLVLAEKEDENGFFKLHCKEYPALISKGYADYFAPVNTPAAVNAFLEYWKPYALVLVESEVWPNLFLIASANGVMLTLSTPVIDAIQIFTHSSIGKSDLKQSDSSKEKEKKDDGSPGALTVLPLYAMLPGYEGRERFKSYNPWNGISKASAAQRAGRTAPDHCYRLYSSAVFNNIFPDFSTAEILKISVDGVVLLMKSIGIKMMEELLSESQLSGESTGSIGRSKGASISSSHQQISVTVVTEFVRWNEEAISRCTLLSPQPGNLATNVKTLFTCLLDQVSHVSRRVVAAAASAKLLLLLVEAVLDLSWLLYNVVEAVWLSFNIVDGAHAASCEEIATSMSSVEGAAYKGLQQCIETVMTEVERLLSAEQKATDYKSPDESIVPDHRLQILGIDGKDVERLTFSVSPHDFGVGEGGWAGLCFSPSQWSTIHV